MELVKLLLGNRKSIVDYYATGGACYQEIHKMITQIEQDELETYISISPEDKRIYRLLTGNFNLYNIDGKSQENTHRNSTLNWLPGNDFFRVVAELVQVYNINYIEEIFAGLGLLSGVLKRILIHVRVTASDNLDTPDVSEKLDYIKIAKRGPEDFQYYSQLNEPIPQMIITGHYPSNGKYDNYLDQLSTLVQSELHGIIIIIYPIDLMQIYELLFYLSHEHPYRLHCGYFRGIDKYFSIGQLFHKYYPSTLMAALLVHENYLRLNPNPNNIWKNTLIESQYIDYYPIKFSQFKLIYNFLPEQLVASIYQHTDLKKTIYGGENMNLQKILEYISNLQKLKIHVPKYFYKLEEFFLWSFCVLENGLPFIFINREQFLNFFHACQNIGTYHFPQWINNHKLIYIYLYMDVLQLEGDWRTNPNTFVQKWNYLKTSNEKILRT